MHPSTNKNLTVTVVAIEAVRALAPVLERIQRRDKSLADQLRRAAASVALNLGEASHNHAGNRRVRLESARGSANEARVALAVAAAFGYVSDEDVAPVDALYDRVLAMAYRLWARS